MSVRADPAVYVIHPVERQPLGFDFGPNLSGLESISAPEVVIEEVATGTDVTVDLLASAPSIDGTIVRVVVENAEAGKSYDCTVSAVIAANRTDAIVLRLDTWPKGS